MVFGFLCCRWVLVGMGFGGWVLSFGWLGFGWVGFGF